LQNVAGFFQAAQAFAVNYYRTGGLIQFNRDAKLAHTANAGKTIFARQKVGNPGGSAANRVKNYRPVADRFIAGYGDFPP
jgi:hypothetical protein